MFLLLFLLAYPGINSGKAIVIQQVKPPSEVLVVYVPDRKKQRSASGVTVSS